MIKKIISENALNDMMDVIVSATNRGFKEGEKDMEVIYNKIEDLPDWAKPSVEKALNAGVLKGTGKGLGLTLTETKILVWLDRCGCIK